MALALTQDFDDGTQATYWRIYESNLCWAEDRGVIAVAGYISEDVRKAGKRPLRVIQITFEGPGFQGFRASVDENQDLLTLLYGVVKQQQVFDGAKDI